MKNFIVPVDFSEDSLKGLELALLFSMKQNINIQMVYVQKSSDDFKPGTFEEEHRYAEKRFREIIEKYTPHLRNDSKLRYIIKKGRIYQEIVDQAESYKESVISASTHGASGFEEFFIGSNAYKIISATANPVFTIRKKVPSEIRKIVVPLKLHVDTRQKVPVAAEIAGIFGAEVHLITISTSRNKKDNDRLNAYLKQSIDYLSKRNITSVAKKLYGENLVTLASNYSNAIDADLAVIMMYKASNLEILMGSYGQQMLYRSEIPVLSITPREKHVPAGFTTEGKY